MFVCIRLVSIFLSALFREGARTSHFLKCSESYSFVLPGLAGAFPPLATPLLMLKVPPLLSGGADKFEAVAGQRLQQMLRAVD